MTSTLSGATVQTAEGNEFNNAARDQNKVTQNFNIRINTFVLLSAFLDAIFNRRGQLPLVASDSAALDNSSNAQRQVAADSGLSVPPSIATIADITSDDANPSSQTVLDGVNCTISALSPPASIPQKYTVSMLECASGYPLYDPRPEGGPFTEYGKKGIRIGDVGIVTKYGNFDFLFNVCPSQNSSINPPELPEDFEVLEHPEISFIPEHFPDDTHLFSNGVSIEEEPRVSYKCSKTEGAILELPFGASVLEAKNNLPFKALAARHAENWYKYIIVKRGRDVPNGSLYLITSCIKCTYWGIAVFDRPSSAQGHLQFVLSDRESQPSHRWMGSGAVIRKVAPNTANDRSPNQCVFLNGYKIMLREDIWSSLMDDECIATNVGKSPSHYPNPKESSQGRGSESASGNGSQAGGGSTAGSNYSTTTFTLEHNEKPVETDESVTKMNPFHQKQTPRNKASLLGASSGSERVLLEAATNVPSLAHPSDLFNMILLEQEPAARVAITHDDDWCGLLRDFCPFALEHDVDVNRGQTLAASPVANMDRLEDISKSYRSTVDEHGCAFLERIPIDPRGSDAPEATATQQERAVKIGKPSPALTPVPEVTIQRIKHSGLALKQPDLATTSAPEVTAPTVNTDTAIQMNVPLRILELLATIALPGISPAAAAAVKLCAAVKDVQTDGMEYDQLTQDAAWLIFVAFHDVREMGVKFSDGELQQKFDLLTGVLQRILKLAERNASLDEDVLYFFQGDAENLSLLKEALQRRLQDFGIQSFTELRERAREQLQIRGHHKLRRGDTRNVNYNNTITNDSKYNAKDLAKNYGTLNTQNSGDGPGDE